MNIYKRIESIQTFVDGRSILRFFGESVEEHTSALWGTKNQPLPGGYYVTHPDGSSRYMSSSDFRGLVV